MPIDPSIAALTHAEIRALDTGRFEGLRDYCLGEIERASRIRRVCEWITGPSAIVAVIGGQLSILHLLHRDPWESYWFILYSVSSAAALLWLFTHRALKEASELAQRDAEPYREVLQRIREVEIARRRAAEMQCAAPTK